MRQSNGAVSRAPVVDVWYVGVDQVPGSLAVLLDDSDRARHRRILPEPDRDRFLAAWVLARLVLGARLGRDPAALSFDRGCTHCGDRRHGKPAVEGLDFSLSRAGGLVTVAVSDQPVGVDVEDTAAGEQPLAAALTERERAACSTYASFARLWTSKEAVLKVAGVGLAIHPSRIEVLGSALVALPEELGHPQDYTLRDIALPAPYVGSLAVLGPEPALSVRNGAELVGAAAATGRRRL